MVPLSKGNIVGIFDQAAGFVKGVRYHGLETPRLAEAVGQPLESGAVAEVAARIRENRLDPATLSDRIVLMAPEIEREMARDGVGGAERRSVVLASAALRTSRELEAGHLPDHDRTLANRMMLDAAYQATAANELRSRTSGVGVRSAGPASDLIGPSNAEESLKAMRRVDADALRAAAAGDLSALPYATRKTFAQDAVHLASSGSIEDARAGLPRHDRRVDPSLLLASAMKARDSASR